MTVAIEAAATLLLPPPVAPPAPAPLPSAPPPPAAAPSAPLPPPPALELSAHECKRDIDAVRIQSSSYIIEKWR